MAKLAEAIEIAVPKTGAEDGHTVRVARAAIESLSRAVGGAEDATLNVAFVADLMQAAEEAGHIRDYGVLMLDVELDIRVHAIIEPGSITFDVRDMKTGRQPVAPICFVMIAGKPEKVGSLSTMPLANLEFLAIDTARSLSAQRHQKSLPDGVVSLDARRHKG